MKRWIPLSTLGLLVLLCVSALVIWSGAHYLSRDLPPVDSIRQLQLSVPLRVLSEDGKLIGQFGAERRSLLRYDDIPRSEEHTSELQSLMRISYAVFCLKKKKRLKCTN